MLHTTRAIVLRTIEHSDSRVILKAYTELFGARSYMVRMGKKNGERSLLQPLSRLELVVSESHERDMHAVKELRMERPYVNVGRDPLRGVLLLFTQELLHRTLREEVGDPFLFADMHASLERMDTHPDQAGYPLRLLVLLLGHLGIRPAPQEEGEAIFDLREGAFLRTTPPHEFLLDPLASALLARLLDQGADDLPVHSLAPAQVRRVLLDGLLLYLRLHMESFGELRSPEVLKQVLG